MILATVREWRVNRFTLLLSLVTLLPSYSARHPATAEQTFPPRELIGQVPSAILALNYSVACQANPQFPAINARVWRAGREIRFQLFYRENHTQVLLGEMLPGDSAQTVSEQVQLEPNPECELRSLQAQLTSMDTTVSARDPLNQRQQSRLAIKHSPFLIIRPDQLQNHQTDLPLALAYSIFTSPQGTTILRYTMIFSDEDSQPSENDTEFQMARYGRRTDIEWLYQVELDRDLNVLNRTYQGDIILGAGHSTRPFHGEFLPHTLHPVLYNVATHNVFSDQPLPEQKRFKHLIGFALFPADEIPAPLAREQVMLQHPWIFEASDAELAREHRLQQAITEYLLVEINGQLNQGKFRAVVETNGGTRFLSGNGLGDVDRLGEDLWHRQSFTGIPLSEAILEDLGYRIHGEFHLEQTSLTRPNLDLMQLRFFRVRKDEKQVSIEEVSHHFDCAYEGIETRCWF